MSALDALRNSVSGMTSQSTKLAGISNNIANSSTVGYKRVDTQFESLVLEGAGSGSYAMAGAAAMNRVEISKAGQVQRTGVDTDIAVSGNGFLVVNDKVDGGRYLATRAGSFRTDAEGNLVNASGYYLQGIPVDAAGNPLAAAGDNNIDSLQTVNINDVTVASAPTTTMTFWANLTAESTSLSPQSVADAAAKTSTVDYYDQLGRSQSLTFKFTPTAATAGVASNTWTLEITDSASGAAIADVEMEFSPTSNSPEVAGTLNQVTATTGTYDNASGILSVTTGDGSPLSINIGALHSTSGMSQLSGSYQPTRVEKDGSAFGLMQKVSVTDDGQVMAFFSNGSSRPIYQLRLAVFPNPDGLNPVNGDAYELSRNAGVARLLKPGEGAAGSVSGGALEASNVDIGTELTNLIETQRAYSSNASVVRTADQMLEEATRLKN